MPLGAHKPFAVRQLARVLKRRTGFKSRSRRIFFFTVLRFSVVGVPAIKGFPRPYDRLVHLVSLVFVVVSYVAESMSESHFSHIQPFGSAVSTLLGCTGTTGITKISQMGKTPVGVDEADHPAYWPLYLLGRQPLKKGVVMTLVCPTSNGDECRG